jgi:hypothetical protein
MLFKFHHRRLDEDVDDRIVGASMVYKVAWGATAAAEFPEKMPTDDERFALLCFSVLFGRDV